MDRTDDASIRCAEARLRTAFDLHAAGIELQIEKLRRAHPDASRAMLRTWVADWLAERPPEQDYGRRVPWPSR